MTTPRGLLDVVESRLRDVPPLRSTVLEDVFAQTRTMPQRRHRWPLHILEHRRARLPGVSADDARRAPIPATIGPVPARGFTMFSAVKLVVAGIIVALFGGFLLAGLLGTGPREEIAPAAESASLTPTGIEILSRNAWGPATHGLVADGEGILWALEHPGRLVRLDPATDTTTMWTLADDITFGRAHTIAASDSGGVWLVGADEVRLFDGDRFTQVIEAPEPLARAVEADDASLWATSEHGAVLHWDGSTWTNVGPGSPGEDYWILALEVDAAGQPWIGGAQCPVDLEGECSPEVLVFDGSEWTRFDKSDAMPLGGLPQSIKQMPDGSIWVATEGGLARFDGTAWTAESPVPGALYQSLAASPDGTVWASSNVDSARVWRSDGTDWAVYGKAEGLPSLDWSAILAIVGDRVFLGTDAGTYQRKGDGWVPAWDVVALGLDTPRLLATGGDELWSSRRRAPGTARAEPGPTGWRGRTRRTWSMTSQSDPMAPCGSPDPMASPTEMVVAGSSSTSGRPGPSPSMAKAPCGLRGSRTAA